MATLSPGVEGGYFYNKHPSRFSHNVDRSTKLDMGSKGWNMTLFRRYSNVGKVTDHWPVKTGQFSSVCQSEIMSRSRRCLCGNTIERRLLDTEAMQQSVKAW